jgi:polyisoprenoid-binding protein YceI
MLGRKLLVSSVVLAGLTFSLVAAAALSKAGDAKVGFIAKAPGGLNIDGKTTDVEITDDGTTVKITARLDKIDTGSELRDKHTKEDLQVDQFPTASIKVPRASLKLDGGEGDAKGLLKVHGQEKEVTFHYVAKKSDKLAVHADAEIAVGDFGVSPRQYLGISIDKKVKLYADFTVVDK